MHHARSTLIILMIAAALLFGTPSFSAAPGEGIKVYGHWKVEIFNPDGERVSTTEFENALEEGIGQLHLIKILSGQSVHGAWGIKLESEVTPQPCDSNFIGCTIGESGVDYGAVELNSTDLNVTADETVYPLNIILSGSVTAEFDSNIRKVMTTVSYCSGIKTPMTCNTNPDMKWQTFTRALIASPPSVVSGQLIQVTVTISFS